MSKQIDVLVWDANSHAPIFRDDEFVIIPPEACLAAIEVKGTLGSDDLVDALTNLERVTTLARFVNNFRVFRPPFRAVFAFGKKDREKDAQGKDKEKNYVAWPNTVLSSLWKHHQIGDAEYPWTIADRLNHARRGIPGSFQLPWIDMVCILGAGFVTLQEWSLNNVSTPTYAAFDSIGDADGSFSAMHTELTMRLLAPEGYMSRDRPGLMSVSLFSAEKRSAPAYMPLEKPPATIESIGSLGKETVAALAAAWHRPRGVKDWPPKPKAAEESDDE
jgi:hypothetical protein